MKALLIFGLLLVGISARSLFLMGREVAINVRLGAQYSVEPIPNSGSGSLAGANRAELASHQVNLTDDQSSTGDPTARAVGPVRIEVDGRDYSSAALVTIRPGFNDDNRYWGYVQLSTLIDRPNGTQQLAVAQNLGNNQYRVLLVGTDGHVTEETFSYSERCRPPASLCPRQRHPVADAPAGTRVRVGDDVLAAPA